MHTFYADEDGNVDVPNSAPVEDSQGNWYGTTEFVSGDPLVRPAGATTGATGDVIYTDRIYEIMRNGVFKTLYAFPGSGDIGINGLVLAPDGNLYGTTQLGGSYGLGSVFRFTPDGVLTTLYSFGAPEANYEEGVIPLIPLVVGVDGALYGATSGTAVPNGPDSGAVFRITLSGELTTLYPFYDGEGAATSALTPMPDGYLYGVRKYGSPAHTGSIFRVSSTGGGYSELSDFWPDGANYPAAPLLRGLDNALYGTTPNGGKYESGTLFRYVPPPVQ